MSVRFVVFALMIGLICCEAADRAEAGAAPAYFTASVADGALMSPDRTLRQKVYWTLFAGGAHPTDPQVQIAGVPLSAKSKAASVYHSSQNDLIDSSAVAFDSNGRLWILSFGQTNGDPCSVLVFDLPMTAKSLPVLTFVLSGTDGADALAFDPSGDLWVASPGNQSAMEYTGPFTQSGTLTPAKTISSGLDNPFAIAVNKNGIVYVSNFASTGTNSIAVVKPPYTAKPYFLNGLTSPGGLVFDNVGNLYASTNGSTPAIVRYNNNHLKSGDTPSIVDPAGLKATTYEAAFAFTAHGDLYAANCGNNGTAGIQVWPLRRRKFSPALAPSVSYTNAKIKGIGCAWGIAIR